MPATDPYLVPSTSLRSRAGRALWSVVWLMLFRTSPRPAFAWRAALLRLFGAQLGPNCHIYPAARVWAPWLLVCEDAVCIADEAVVYNPAGVHLGSHCVISQQAYLCGAGHDVDDPAFPMVSRHIEVGAYAWVAARATVCPGVQLGEGAVLALGAVATRALQPWGVYAGVPARWHRQRKRPHAS
ncbi:putative colanic acid biosynthesis acetyltransferase [Rubrivivax rivuli]|uniref:putative colanic acid biosynthesis acetyltransferase n=1 Tax=Rubrivivax rivuli TaxID=1862385 RepID=UPI001FE0C0F6|nr:putative colanic acid biosynthesis acetyltransferase [Rubrivivax rivuli]